MRINLALSPAHTRYNNDYEYFLKIISLAAVVVRKVSVEVNNGDLKSIKLARKITLSATTSSGVQAFVVWVAIKNRHLNYY